MSCVRSYAVDGRKDQPKTVHLRFSDVFIVIKRSVGLMCKHWLDKHKNPPAFRYVRGILTLLYHLAFTSEDGKRRKYVRTLAITSEEHLCIDFMKIDNI
jgi:hypothetical protein